MHPLPSMTVLRIARPTDSIQALLPFYCHGLGLQVLGFFSNHAGFDGVMLGRSGLPYHLEFTHEPGHPAGKAPTRDHLLVFYLPEREAWERAVQSMRRAGLDPVPSWNPYWDLAGLTYEDADGYRVVLQNAAWTES